jgi:hypothetical protein
VLDEVAVAGFTLPKCFEDLLEKAVVATHRLGR